jgi:hypothetical protein
MGSVQSRVPIGGTERKPFGADDFDVGDADGEAVRSVG